MNKKIRLVIIMMCLSVVTSCGNGVGGTGISGVSPAPDNSGNGGLVETSIVIGRLSNLVNGYMQVDSINFNTESATFIRDGLSSKVQNDFHLGEVVKVTGIIDEDGQSAVAMTVVFSDTLEGPVTTISAGNTIEIMGQTILVDPSTQLHGFNAISELGLDSVVEVSGFIDIQGRVKASSLRLIFSLVDDNHSIDFGIEGVIRNPDSIEKTFTINNLSVDYATALFENVSENQLVDGLFVVVSTNQNVIKNTINNTIVATDIVVDNSTLNLNAGDLYNVEGFVTSIVSESQFHIKRLPIITTAQTVYINGSIVDVEENRFMRILGQVNSQGSIVVTEITFLK